MSTEFSSDRTTSSEAILGVLSLRPMTGYEIRQYIAASIGNFWSESFGQIYPTLKLLKRQGMVEVAPEGKANRKVYTLTAAGRERLERWIPLMPRPRVPRNELLLKLFFGAAAPPEAMRAQVLERRGRCVADLARYDGIVADIRHRHARNPNLPFWLMTLSYGRAEARALIAWCDETVAALEGMGRGKALRAKQQKVA